METAILPDIAPVTVPTIRQRLFRKFPIGDDFLRQAFFRDRLFRLTFLGFCLLRLTLFRFCLLRKAFLRFCLLRLTLFRDRFLRLTFLRLRLLRLCRFFRKCYRFQRIFQFGHSFQIFQHNPAFGMPFFQQAAIPVPGLHHLSLRPILFTHFQPKPVRLLCHFVEKGSHDRAFLFYQKKIRFFLCSLSCHGYRRLIQNGTDARFFLSFGFSFPFSAFHRCHFFFYDGFRRNLPFFQFSQILSAFLDLKLQTLIFQLFLFQLKTNRLFIQCRQCLSFGDTISRTYIYFFDFLIFFQVDILGSLIRNIPIQTDCPAVIPAV